MIDALVDKPIKGRLDFIGSQRPRDSFPPDDLGNEASGKDVFKEEFMNQLKLMDISISSPSHLVSPIPISFGLEEGLFFQGKSTLTDNFEGSGLVSYEQAKDGMGHYLEELLLEQNLYNYQRKSVAQRVKKSIRDDITSFASQLVEKKRNLPRVLHEIPTTSLGIQLTDLQTQETLTLKKKEESSKDKAMDFKDSIINEKLEWIRLKKKVETMNDLNPLTLNIEGIFTLSEGIKVTEDDGTVPPKNLQTDAGQRDKEIQQIVKEMQKNKKTKLKDPTQIFRDQLESSVQMTSKEAIYANVNVFSGKASLYNYSHSITLPSQQQTEPSQHSLNVMDQTEIVEINFYRDLAPCTRRFAKPVDGSKWEKAQLRKEQKRILIEQIEIEPSLPNIDEDMYLLAISGQAPIDYLIKRMNSLSKWEIKEKNLYNLIYRNESSLSEDFNDSFEENRIEEKKVSFNTNDGFHLDLIRTKLSPPSKKTSQQAYDQAVKRARISSEIVDHEDDEKLHELYQQLDVKQSVDNLLSQDKQKSVQDFKIEEYQVKRDTRVDSSQQKSYIDERSSSNERNGLRKDRNRFGEQLSIISEKNSQTADNSMAQDFLRNFKQLDQKPDIAPKLNPDIVNLKINNTKEAAGERRRVNELNIKVIAEECETSIKARLSQIDQLKDSKKELDQAIQRMQAQKKQGNTKLLAYNVKNNERMKREINKRIESHMLYIVQILDQKTQEAKADLIDTSSEMIQSDILTTETILKASQLGNDEEIDEQVKAKFISRLVREFCNNRERAKQCQLREQMNKEIEQNIFRRFPGLSNSPPSHRYDKTAQTQKTSHMSPIKAKTFKTSSQKKQPESKKGQMSQRSLVNYPEIKKASNRIKHNKRLVQDAPPDDEWIGSDHTNDLNDRDWRSNI